MKHLQHFAVAQKSAQSKGCATFIKYFSVDFILFEAGEHMSVLKYKGQNINNNNKRNDGCNKMPWHWSK